MTHRWKKTMNIDERMACELIETMKHWAVLVLHRVLEEMGLPRHLFLPRRSILVK